MAYRYHLLAGQVSFVGFTSKTSYFIWSHKTQLLFDEPLSKYFANVKLIYDSPVPQKLVVSILSPRHSMIYYTNGESWGPKWEFEVMLK